MPVASGRVTPGVFHAAHAFAQKNSVCLAGFSAVLCSVVEKGKLSGELGKLCVCEEVQEVHLKRRVCLCQ